MIARNVCWLLVLLFCSVHLLSQSGIEIPQFNAFKTSTQVLSFIENKGQVYDQNHKQRPDILFVGSSGPLNFYLKQQGISFQTTRVESWKKDMVRTLLNEATDSLPSQYSTHRIDINWLNCKPHCQVISRQLNKDVLSYYNKNSPLGIHNIHSYQSIHYEGLYDGIDLKWYNYKGQLKYDFILGPGADASQIEWQVDGADEIYLDSTKNLVISTPYGNITTKAPVSYQGDRQVKSWWILDENILRIGLGKYNPDQELVIDPLVVLRDWATFYGGQSRDELYKSTTDGKGNIYACGATFSTKNMATTGAYQSTHNIDALDAFLIKIKANGIRAWGTYYGGSGRDWFTDVKCKDGMLYTAGYTESTSSIATKGSHQSVFGGGNSIEPLDAFLAKFSVKGVRQWATYYGGDSTDYATALAVDGSSNIYMTGVTFSPNGISTTGCHQDTQGGYGWHDCFLAKFNKNGIRQWGTYIGGNQLDVPYDCAVDGSGGIVVAGYTSSRTNMATPGTHKPQFIYSIYSNYDGFVMKFNNKGIREWGSYYGGERSDLVTGCAINAQNEIVLVGITGSFTNMHTSGAFQDTMLLHSQGSYAFGEGFIAKLNSNGQRIWATYYGSQFNDALSSCILDTLSNIYVIGSTDSDSGLSTVYSYQEKSNGMVDAILAKFNTKGKRLWASYLGGEDNDNGRDCEFYSNYLYAVGSTYSDSLLTTKGSHQTSKVSSTQGDKDGFLARLSECQVSTSWLKISACDQYKSPSGKYVWTESGTYSDTLANGFGCDSLISIDLTIVNKSSSKTSVNACSSYTSPSGQYTWTSSGTY